MNPVTPQQQTQLDHAADYELAAARCLAMRQVDEAEYLLTFADELHEMVDRDEGVAA